VVALVRCKSCGHDNPAEAHFCANCGSNLVAAIEQSLPAEITDAETAMPAAAVEYMGFWVRFGAAIIDGVIISLIFSLLSRFAFDFFRRLFFTSELLVLLLVISLPWLYHWLFIGLKGQTLGKMAAGIKVVNATGSIPGLGSAALREVLGKSISFMALCLGFLWIIWDGWKQGWHDKIANTCVVRAEKDSRRRRSYAVS